MAGGNSYCESSIKVGGTDVTDVTDWTIMLGAELLSNRSDGNKYPQLGCSVNHTAEVGFKTLNLAQALQASSSATLIGKVETTVVLTAENITGTSYVFTIGAARCNRANGQGGHAKLADMDMAYEAVGTAGAEPTVSAAVAS